eukprot:8684035-Lingulodinium_polyedra.AAC.1
MPRTPGDLPALHAAWRRSCAAVGPLAGISRATWPTATRGPNAYGLPRTLTWVPASTRAAIRAA